MVVEMNLLVDLQMWIESGGLAIFIFVGAFP